MPRRNLTRRSRALAPAASLPFLVAPELLPLPAAAQERPPDGPYPAVVEKLIAAMESDGGGYLPVAVAQEGI